MSTLRIAIDPGAKTGVAYIDQYGSRGGFSVKAENLEDDLRLILGDCDRVECVIERCSYKAPRFLAHRQSAKQAEAVVKKIWPYRNKVKWAEPKTWQEALGVCNPKDIMRPHNNGRLCYLTYAWHFLGLKSDSEDEAAARCILSWAEKTRLFDQPKKAIAKAKKEKE